MKGKSMVSIGMARCNLRVEGAKAVAELVSVIASLTECNLRKNSLGVEGWTIIFNALRDSPTSKITTWDLSNERLGPEIAKPLAEYISVSASVTKIFVGWNRLRDEGTIILCDALRESTVSKVEELSLHNNDIGRHGAKAIAALCTVCASLTKILVQGNKLGDEGGKLLREAVQGREDFELEL